MGRTARAATILLLFALALFLRAREPGLVRFGIDQTSHFDPIHNLVRHGMAPLYGPDVSFTPAKLGPFHFYLFAPPMLVSTDPDLSLYWSALLNALGVPLLFLACRGRFPFAGAACAAALYAVSPWMVWVSRELWNLAGILPLNLLLLALLLEAADRRSAPLFALAFGAVAALSQLHIVSALQALPVAGAAFLLLPPGPRGRAFAGGAALSLLLYAPWLLHQVRTGGEDLLAYAAFLASPGRSALALNPAALPTFLDYPRFLLNYVDDYRSPLFESAAFLYPARLELALLLAGLAALARAAAARGAAALPARLLHALILTPPLALHLFRFELFDRHFLPAFPYPLLAVGLLAGRLAARDTPDALAARPLFAAALACLFLQNFEFTRQIELRSLVKDELPLAEKRAVVEAMARQFGPCDPLTIEGAIHVIGGRDQPSDYRLLGELLGRFPAEGPPLDLAAPHVVLVRPPDLRDDDAARRSDLLRMATGEVVAVAGATRVIAAESLIDYASLEYRRLDDPDAGWVPYRNPFLAVEGEFPARFRGAFRRPAHADAVLLAVHTNLPLYDFKVNGDAVFPLPYPAQGTTSEVLAEARLVRIGREALRDRNEFVFGAGPVHRWYGVDLFALPLVDATRRLDLAPLATLRLAASPGGTIEARAGEGGLRASYRLASGRDWTRLSLAPRAPVDWFDYREVEAAVTPDGLPGLLRLSLVESEGEEWVFDDYAALGRTGETVVRAPFRLFTNPPWAKRGNGVFEPDRLAALAFTFLPYGGAFGTREVTIRRAGLAD